VPDFEKIFRLDKVLRTGVFPGLADKSPPALVDSRNIIWDEESLQPIPGQAKLFPRQASLPVLGMTSLYISGVKWLYFANQDEWRKWDGTTHSVAGSGFTGTDRNLWSAVPWGPWVIATNAVNVPQVDKGAGFVALGGSPPSTVEVFVKFKNFLLGFNTSLSPTEIIWSQSDNPEVWTAAATNDAGKRNARDLDSPIRAAALLGNSIAYYSENEMRAVQYIGGTSIFNSIPLLKGIGALGKNCVVPVGRYHFGWGRKGIWRTDGTGFDYLDQPAVRDFIRQTLNEDMQDIVCGFHYPQHHLVGFFYPGVGQIANTIGLGMNYLGDPSWWVIGYGRSVFLEESVFGNPLFGTSDGDVLEQSLEHSVPTSLDDPLRMSSTFSLDAGFGQTGFGQLGFGGVGSPENG